MSTYPNDNISFESLSEDFDDEAGASVADSIMALYGEGTVTMFCIIPEAFPEVQAAVHDLYTAYCAYPA
jgi:hypothetical protein